MWLILVFIAYVLMCESIIFPHILAYADAMLRQCL